MSFTTNSSDKFSIVYDKSEYNSLDPIVKVQHLQKGNNIVFGRSIKDNDFSKLIYIGKVAENTIGKNYLAADAWLDVTYPHVIYITGTRGSGKSFDLGVILEGISALENESAIQNESQPICSILIDTQSQFWTLQYPPIQSVPENKQQLEQLKKWNIRPNALSNCKLFIPPKTQIITGKESVFHLKPSQVTPEEWCALIREDVYSPQGHIIALTIDAMTGDDYTIEDMIRHASSNVHWPNTQESSRNAVIYKLDDYRRTGLFSSTGLNVKDILVPSQCSVFMLRDLRNEDKSLVTSIIARQLFIIMGEYHKQLKMQKFFKNGELEEKLPSKVWLLIDEAHVVAPSGESSPARDVLIEYVKRGRDAGLSLVLATQQPSAIDDRILSQVNITFTHRLTFQSDISSAVNRIPTKLLSKMKLSGVEIKDFGDMLRYLESGQCFLGDHNTSRVVMLNIRPRVTSHGGYSPI
jgi:hypothetical protein